MLPISLESTIANQAPRITPNNSIGAVSLSQEVQRTEQPSLHAVIRLRDGIEEEWQFMKTGNPDDPEKQNIVTSAWANDGLRLHGPAFLDSLYVPGQTYRFASVSDDTLPDHPLKQAHMSTVYIHPSGQVTYSVTDFTVASARGVLHFEAGSKYDQNIANTDKYGAVSIPSQEIDYYSSGNFRLQPMRDAYRRLGFDGIGTPTPLTLIRNLSSARIHDSQSGVYYPEVAFFHGGQIAAPDYLEAFAQRRYPIATGSFTYYFHDIAQVHFQTLLRDGQPVVDLLAAFSSVALQPHVALKLGALSNQSDTLFVGAEKLAHAAGAIDTFTADLSRVPLDGIEHIDFQKSLHNRLVRAADIIVQAINTQGDIRSIPFITDMFEQGSVSQPEELTGSTVLQQIVDLSRRRLAIEADSYLGSIFAK